MEQIAFITGNHIIYWRSMILTVAIAAAVCLFMAAYLKGGRLGAGMTIAAMAMAFSLVLSRIVHWYCYTESYGSFLQAVTDYSSGGYVLIGCFVGCFLAALLTRAVGIHDHLGKVLDVMCLSGSLGIALGRLASFFDAADRGQIVQGEHSAPWVCPVVNSISGSTEYRVATFFIQAVVAELLFLALLCLYRKKRRVWKDGEMTLFFLLTYCASQIVLDSTRYDSLYFRFNGFISIVQVVSAIALAVVIVIYFARSIKALGWRRRHILGIPAVIALMGCAGYMEYYVQRHGDLALQCYSVMSLSLCTLVGLMIKFRKVPDRESAQVQREKTSEVMLL